MEEEYKETIDYTWTLARAIDRAAAARARTHGKITKAELQLRLSEYRSSLRALYAILPPSIRSEVTPPPSKSIKEMDEWLATVVAELDKRKLLLRKKNPAGVKEEL